jgi:hypothetical protein
MKHRIQLSLFVLLLSATAFAQQITVKNFGQATQFIAASDQIRDWDNELCALVKIQGAKIDSVSGAFEVRKLGSEVWVYMTDGDRKLTIHKDGYEPKDVVFKDYGVDNVKSNKVYLMTIFAPELTKQKFFVGLFGGANFTTSGLKADYAGSADWVFGFNVGASAYYMFSDMIGASVGLFFAQKGYKYSIDNAVQTIVDEKGEFQFLDIPVQALLHFDLSDAVAMQILAGPCFSLNIGGKATCNNPYLSEKFSDMYSTFQMGGQAGVRFVFAKHIAVGAKYQFGFSDYKCQDIGINIGYIF